MQELGVLATLRRIAADSETLKASAAIAVTAAASVDLAHLPHAVFGGGAVAVATAGGAAEAERRSQARRQRVSNEFYFLCEANRAASRLNPSVRRASGAF